MPSLGYAPSPLVRVVGPRALPSSWSGKGADAEMKRRGADITDLVSSFPGLAAWMPAEQRVRRGRMVRPAVQWRRCVTGHGCGVRGAAHCGSSACHFEWKLARNVSSKKSKVFRVHWWRPSSCSVSLSPIKETVGRKTPYGGFAAQD